MKMMITEKQLSKILKKDVEIEEAEESEPSPSTPTTPAASNSSAIGYDKSSYFGSTPQSTTTDPGSSPSADEYPAYPETVKWESGVTRGPANQIGVTKWSDTVGSSLTRGKANPLK